MISADTLARLLPAYLVRQRWFGLSRDVDLEVVVDELEVWRDTWPGLVWAVATARTAEGAEATFQVIVGLRSVDEYPHFLDGKGQWLLGDVHLDAGEALAFDALIDPELAVVVFDKIAPELEVQGVRPLTVEQTNTSVVGDEKWMLKIFRRLDEGNNPDVDVPRRLWSAGFTQTPEPVVEWRRGEFDLAVVRRFHSGATDGFVLAETSLRDLYDARVQPGEAGGDFAPEAFRLGGIIGRMHLALGNAYAVETVQTAELIAEVTDDLLRASVPDVSSLDVNAWAGAVARELPSELAAQRVHGDLHLGQLIRGDEGWMVLDFEGEPSRPVAARTRLQSPWRDVAGVLRSFDYATQVTLVDRGDVEVDEELVALAELWRRHNRDAFMIGYREVMGDAVGHGGAEADGIVRFFEMAKAIYEVSYELAHRPEWVAIPEAAVRALLAERLR